MANEFKNMTKGAGPLFELGSRYEPIKMIGNGAYGIVCSAKDTRIGRKVAVKKICRVFDIPTIARRTLRELRILRHFRHDNVIGLHDVVEPSQDKASFHDVYVALDLMESDLHNIIHSDQPLSDEHMRYFLYQLLRGLKYIHSANIIHRDLKPSNLLVNRDCQLKIGDFGMARSLSSSPGEQKRVMTEYVATRWYRAPELMLSLHQFTKGIDTWSVGCILAEMFGRRPLFPGSNYLNQLQLILSVVGLPSVDFMATISSERVQKYINKLPHKEAVQLETLFPKACPEGVALLEKMLRLDPSNRISTEEGLAHPYLKKYHSLDDEPTCRPLDFSFDSIPADRELLKNAIWDEIKDYHTKKPQLHLAPVITNGSCLNGAKKDMAATGEHVQGEQMISQLRTQGGPVKIQRKRRRSEHSKPAAEPVTKKGDDSIPDVTSGKVSNSLSETDRKMLERWQNMQKTTKPFVHPIRKHMNELLELKSQSVVKTTAFATNDKSTSDKPLPNNMSVPSSGTQFQFTNFVPQMKGNAVMLVKEGAKKGTSGKINPVVVSRPSGQPTVLVPIGSIPCYRIERSVQNSNQIVILPQGKGIGPKVQAVPLAQPSKASHPQPAVVVSENQAPISATFVSSCAVGKLPPLPATSDSVAQNVNEQPSAASQSVTTQLLRQDEHTVNELVSLSNSLLTVSTEQSHLLCDKGENALLMPQMCHQDELVTSTTDSTPQSLVHVLPLEQQECATANQLTNANKLASDSPGSTLSSVTTFTAEIPQSTLDIITQESLPAVQTDVHGDNLFLSQSPLFSDQDLANVQLGNILTPKNSASGYGLGFDLEEFLNQSTGNDPWSQALEGLPASASAVSRAPLSASLLNEWLERKDMDPSDLAELQLELESTSSSLLFGS